MSKMKVVQVPKQGADFELVERPVPEPGANQVRIKVEACGVCHSDVLTKEGAWPGITYPRVPGHEVVGRIDAVGSGVTAWQVGQRVGVGWHGGHCFECDSCRKGDFMNCSRLHITGISSDGGYAEYMLARQEAVAHFPSGLDAVEAAPLLCAGITTFNALRNSGARPGDRVAIQGIGGLGHLGVQYAAKMGFTTIAISTGQDKEALARKLGASFYVDAGGTDPAAELQKLGGAQVILATAPSAKAMSAVINGLTPRGNLLIVGADFEPMQFVPINLLSGRMIAGWPSGTARDSEDALNFSVLSGVRPMIESFPLTRAAEAYAHMLKGRPRFRVVLTMA
ncbi:MAG TPA: alcohol dehydrogenase [Pirellulales bacterium]|nr:alcohol dehydrogenase [Pirellulales bacterium]